MIIILEGPPGAGKTALASLLRTAIRATSHTSLQVLHGNAGVSVTQDSNAYLSQYLAPLEDYEPGSGQHIICDEWHWTLPAYRTVFNVERPFVDAVRSYVDLKLSQLGAVIVHLNPDAEALTRRLDRRNPYLQPHRRIRDNIASIRSAYTQLMHDSRTTVLPSTASLSTILDTAKYVEERAERVYSRWPWYLGPEKPQGLLVDVDPSDPETLYPHSRTGSSFLHAALSTNRASYDALGMLNAVHTTPTQFVELMRVLDAPRLIALGKVASTFLSGVPHVTVPNHKYARRIASAHPEQYAQLLMDAVTTRVGSDLTDWRPIK